MEIVRWQIDPVLQQATDEHYRSTLAVALREQNLLAIVRRITFDGVADDIKISDVEKLLAIINRKFLAGKIAGVGLEEGAGCGFFSAVLAKRPEVQKVYAVEICPEIVQLLMTKVVVELAVSDKVVGCIGEFNNLELPDKSVDFVFDFFSFHHSDDLEKTFREAWRVLKPGGFVLCLDKARANDLSRTDLEKLLDVEYSVETKKKMAVDPAIRLTRRMNGEKEYRLNDWRQAFLTSGFSVFTHYHLARAASNNRLIYCLKMIISYLPIRLQVFITEKLVKDHGNRNNLETTNQVYLPLLKSFPKEISLLIAYK